MQGSVYKYVSVTLVLNEVETEWLIRELKDGMIGNLTPEEREMRLSFINALEGKVQDV